MVTFEDAKNVAETLAEALDPFSVITFGSVARDGMGADLDLLVVLNDDSRVSGDANLCAHKCLKKFSKYFAVDPFIVGISKFNEYYAKGSPFLRLILKEGKLLYMKNAILEWLKQTEEELNMASYLLKGGYFKGSCFHAQQAIEKSIKARLLRKGWTLEKTHSIQRLIAIVLGFARTQQIQVGSVQYQPPLGCALRGRVGDRLFGRSLKLREVSAAGCNACEADVNVLTTVVFDLGRFGIQFVASPRHADGILITGCVSRNMMLALQKTYEAVPDPRIVIAVGACAISGGPFIDHPEIHNGAASRLLAFPLTQKYRSYKPNYPERPGFLPTSLRPFDQLLASLHRGR